MAEAAINVNPVHTVVLRAGGRRTRACQTVRISISDLKMATYYVLGRSTSTPDVEKSRRDRTRTLSPRHGT
jgi:hypothetical protein